YLLFSSRRRHTRSKRDWSSDVCSSDLHRRTSIVDDTTRAVSQPRNSLRLTRTRRVLNQVTATSTTCSDIVDNLLSSPQLVIAREDQPPLITLGRRLPQGVVTQNPQKQLRLEDFLPQIRGIRTIWIRRVTSVTVIALVERQEERVQAREHRGHLDVLIRHRKVHQSPARLKQRTILGRLTVNLVLLDRVTHRLSVVGFQLHGHHRNAVDRQHQIQGVSAFGVEGHLAQHPKTVLLRILNSI